MTEITIEDRIKASYLIDDSNKLCNKIDGRGSIHGCSKLYQAGTELPVWVT